MIKGDVIKEMHTIQRVKGVDYRALDSLNCSMIKLFDSDPVKFFEQFKLGKKRKDETTTSMIIGNIVDFYLLDCKGKEEEFENRWDEKFALFQGTKKGQVFTLADTMFTVTQENANDKGEVTVTFATRFTDAFERVQAMGLYSGKTEEKALKDFNDNAYDYFQARLDNVGKTVVDISLVEKAKKIAKAITEDSFVKGIFEEYEDVELFEKIPIEWVFGKNEGTYNLKCKSEPDLLRVDHGNKTIKIIDIKTTFDNENFEFSYLRHKYYLQGAFYHLAVSEWASKEGMSDYEIIPMTFVVGDTSSNNRRPIQYKMTMKDIEAGLNGFSLKGGQQYKGVLQLIEEIKWAESNDIWNCSKEVFDNKGVMNLTLRYDVD